MSCAPRGSMSILLVNFTKQLLIVNNFYYISRKATDMAKKITVQFLENKGLILTETKRNEFKLESKNGNVKVVLGKSGHFSISEEHWMDEEPIKSFTTTNPALTETDFDDIVRISKINVK